MSQSGFLWVNAPRSTVIIDDVNFSSNMVLVGEEATDVAKEQGTLIFIFALLTLNISNCTFEHNLGYNAGVIRI